MTPVLTVIAFLILGTSGLKLMLLVIPSSDFSPMHFIGIKNDYHCVHILENLIEKEKSALGH